MIGITTNRKVIPMNVAQSVIEKFGGQSALASLIGKRPGTVQYWAKAGTIPSKWHRPLLELAQEKGISLTTTDLVPQSESIQPEIIRDEPSRVPVAKWQGDLVLSAGMSLPCFVLDDGRRVISRTGATGVLTGTGSSDLESYLRAESLKPYMPENLPGQMIEFTLEGVVIHKTAKGIEAETFLEISRAYVKALSEGALKTARQIEVAAQASMFLAACAKVGLIALIDECTGYQYERAQDALQFKLRLFLEQEMRKWEPTFPNELWKEFGRLTNWQGSITSRPKYWGKLVMELVYGYLDPDVADWLKKNAPRPRHGQNYHQWLTSQYGLKRLMEHLWMLVGMARACASMRELRERMAEQYGQQEFQLSLFAPPPARFQRSIGLDSPGTPVANDTPITQEPTT
jgi:hypothetical protein